MRLQPPPLRDQRAAVPSPSLCLHDSSHLHYYVQRSVVLRFLVALCGKQTKGNRAEQTISPHEHCCRWQRYLACVIVMLR